MLAKNPEYYDQAVVKLDKIKGSTIKEENTGIQLFESGELDLQKSADSMCNSTKIMTP